MLNAIQLLIATIIANVTVALPTQDEASWFTDLDRAQAIAKKQGRPLLVDFTGSDWCHWCIRLDEEVFQTKTFRDWARKRVVLVKLDFPRRKAQDLAVRRANEALAQRYGVRGFPTVLLLDHFGKVIGRTGYRDGGAAAWVRHAEALVAKAQPAPRPASGPRWLTDHAAALASAKRAGRPVLAVYTGSDWCSWCKRLKAEVFDTGIFKSWAQRNVVLLELDFPRDRRQPDEVRRRNRALAERYGVRGFPTVLLLDGDGKVLGTFGYERGGARPWIDKVARLLPR